MGGWREGECLKTEKLSNHCCSYALRKDLPGSGDSTHRHGLSLFERYFVGGDLRTQRESDYLLAAAEFPHEPGARVDSAVKISQCEMFVRAVQIIGILPPAQ